jgi:hypothetical protein
MNSISILTFRGAALSSTEEGRKIFLSNFVAPMSNHISKTTKNNPKAVKKFFIFPPQ